MLRVCAVTVKSILGKANGKSPATLWSSGWIVYQTLADFNSISWTVGVAAWIQWGLERKQQINGELSEFSSQKHTENNATDSYTSKEQWIYAHILPILWLQHNIKKDQKSFQTSNYMCSLSIKKISCQQVTNEYNKLIFSPSHQSYLSSCAFVSAEERRWPLKPPWCPPDFLA